MSEQQQTEVKEEQGAPVTGEEKQAEAEAAPSVTALPDVYAYTESKATSKAPFVIVSIILAIGGLIFGFNGSTAWKDRIQLNESLRDSMIVQYEVDKAAKLFDELEAAINGAVLESGKQQYDAKHIEYIGKNLQANPVSARLFTERNYQSFGQDAVRMMTSYYVKWTVLHRMISDHLKQSTADAGALASFKDKLKKIMETQYGVVFNKQDSKVVSDIVYLGAAEEKGEVTNYPVKSGPDGTGEPRELYNPPEEGDEGALSKSPEKYVVAMSQKANSGLLSSGVGAEFDGYARRLYEISAYMKTMRDGQTGLMRWMAVLASQEPAALASPDSEEEFAEYVKKDKQDADQGGAEQESQSK